MPETLIEKFSKLYDRVIEGKVTLELDDAETRRRPTILDFLSEGRKMK